VGLVFIDAHGDFNTPETTLSGMLGGMPVAISAGLGLSRLRIQSGLDPPLPERHIVLAAARDLDPLERELLERSAVERVSVEDIKTLSANLDRQMQRLAGLADVIYIHVDMDVLDPPEVSGHPLTVPNGPTSLELGAALTQMFRHEKAAAFGVASTPSGDRDRDGRSRQAAYNLILGALKGVQQRGRPPATAAAIASDAQRPVARTVQARDGNKAAAAPFTVVEATIAEMQKALEAKRTTSRELVEQYLARIASYNDKLNATLAVNARALAEADERDRERARKQVRGPLHGIPIALKDNIHTTDMPTTGGALVFDGFVPSYEATLARNLREAGAIILAKTGMTELANWVAGAPYPMPTNYNALHGYGMNPYDPRRDPREATFDGRPALATGGSSSGVGTAASFWAANVGTETSGSILSPANQNMLAGIKPTVGRVSRHGIIPITADQDTAGPMARTVADAALLMGVLESAAPDPQDAATSRCPPPPGRDYTRFLDAGALKGARIGIPRAFYYDKATPPGATEPRGGLNADQAKVMAEAIEILKSQGAVVVDPADIPSVADKDGKSNLLNWNVCSGAENGRGRDNDCSIVFKYGMKRDFNTWLASLGPSAPVKTLGELRAWNIAHQRAGAIKYGQSNLDISDEMDLEADRRRYEQDRAKDIALAGTHGIDEVMKGQNLDALLFPGGGGAAIAAKPGYPTVIVPFGTVPNAPTTAPFPPGFDARPAPFGVSFTGMACAEPRLIALAYAFEQATRRRVPPPSAP
jgi:amidase